jgi:hypothetical protein
VGRRFVHGHRVARVEIGGHPFKRIRFGDAWLAERTATALEHFAGSGVLPELEARFDEQLLVEFIEGRPLTELAAADAQAMAEFHARIHRGGTRLVPLAASGVLDRAVRDLRFLCEVGVVDPALGERLGERLDATSPPDVQLGWDYTDTVPKNFVRRPDGRLAAIDVEALKPEALVGTGLAKSLARGRPDYRPALLEALARAPASSPAASLLEALPFVELCFQLGWLKNRCLKGSRLDLAQLEARARD